MHASSITAAATCTPRSVAQKRQVGPARRQAFKAATARRAQRVQPPARAQEASVSAQAQAETKAADGNFVPVLLPEELPKGVRKEVRVQGKSVLLFWYRNEIYAIEARSPAEGAYSEGFIRAKFTQDFCIECPATGTLFSFKDGSIVNWYPTNLVLRVLTPVSTCRHVATPLEVYPVRLQQNAIEVDVSSSRARGAGATTRGGSDSSLENNNVFGLEPRAYVEGSSAAGDDGESIASKAATATVTLLAIGVAAAAGAATCIYLFAP